VIGKCRHEFDGGYRFDRIKKIRQLIRHVKETMHRSMVFNAITLAMTLFISHCLIGPAEAAGQAALPAPGPAVEGNVKSGAASLHYWVRGTGAPIVMLSGGPGFASYLHPVMAELSRGHRIVMLDQRGTGHSTVAPMDETTINVQALVEDLETLRKHLGIERWTVLGHSWGGMLAMRYSIAHPESIDALVLVGSGGMNRSFSTYFGSNIRARLLPSDLEAERYWSDPERQRTDPVRATVEVQRALLPGYFYNRAASLPINDALGKPGFFSSTMSGLINNDVADQDIRPGMASCSKPVLLLMGRQDPIGETTQYEIRDTCRLAKLEFIEKSGHFPWIEQPVPFYKSINRFLDTLPATDTR
jgi:proline iminopeptidase